MIEFMVHWEVWHPSILKQTYFVKHRVLGMPSPPGISRFGALYKLLADRPKRHAALSGLSGYVRRILKKRCVTEWGKRRKISWPTPRRGIPLSSSVKTGLKSFRMIYKMVKAYSRFCHCSKRSTSQAIVENQAIQRVPLDSWTENDQSHVFTI